MLIKCYFFVNKKDCEHFNPNLSISFLFFFNPHAQETWAFLWCMMMFENYMTNYFNRTSSSLLGMTAHKTVWRKSWCPATASHRIGWDNGGTQALTNSVTNSKTLSPRALEKYSVTLNWIQKESYNKVLLYFYRYCYFKYS